jgi:hypothetical protein
MDFLFGQETRKQKASRLEIQRSLIVSNTWKISKYTNQAAMKKKKTFQDVNENEHFYYIPPLHKNANDETEEKENSIFKFSTLNIRRQRILTYE